jgi:hypothetical protein
MVCYRGSYDTNKGAPDPKSRDNSKGIDTQFKQKSRGRELRLLRELESRSESKRGVMPTQELLI